MSDRDNILKAPCSCGSGKPMSECHGAGAAVAATLASGPITRRLDLASGQNPRDGFEGVDIWPGAQHVVDLMCYPWPFADGSVAELHCSHYIEHIPMGFIGANRSAFPDIRPYAGHVEPGVKYPVHYGKDALLAFFDECYRILVDDGTMTLIWPSNKSDRAFMDPTHRRFIPAEMLHYIREDWRRETKLDHYNVDCNFHVEATPTIPVEVSARHEIVQVNQIKHMWNTTVDWRASLKKLPRLPPRSA